MVTNAWRLRLAGLMSDVGSLPSPCNFAAEAGDTRKPELSTATRTTRTSHLSELSSETMGCSAKNKASHCRCKSKHVYSHVLTSKKKARRGKSTRKQGRGRRAWRESKKREERREDEEIGLKASSAVMLLQVITGSTNTVVPSHSCIGMSSLPAYADARIQPQLMETGFQQGDRAGLKGWWYSK